MAGVPARSSLISRNRSGGQNSIRKKKSGANRLYHPTQWVCAKNTKRQKARCVCVCACVCVCVCGGCLGGGEKSKPRKRAHTHTFHPVDLAREQLHRLACFTREGEREEMSVAELLAMGGLTKNVRVGSGIKQRERRTPHTGECENARSARGQEQSAHVARSGVWKSTLMRRSCTANETAARTPCAATPHVLNILPAQLEEQERAPPPPTPVLFRKNPACSRLARNKRKKANSN